MILNTKVSIIVVMDEKRGIGKGNDLLFRIPEDMKRMKALTTGHPLIMGRKTFESLGRLLPNRTHIVVTHNPKSLKSLNYRPHFIVSTIEEGIEVGKKIEEDRLSLQRNPPIPPLIKGGNVGAEIFIFGGAQVYSEALRKKLVDKLYLTVVKGDYKADVFFPEYSGFNVKNRELKNEGDYSFTFLELER